MMTTATTTPIADDTYRLRLAAIGLADSRKTRLETDLAAAKKRHADALGKLTEAITALMPKHEADLPDDARGRLVDLFKAHQERDKAEAAKKREVDRINASLKKASAQLTELIRSRVEDRQTALALGDAALADGLGVSHEAAAGIARAIAEVEQAGGKLSVDEQRLRERLQASGVVFSLDDDVEDDSDDAEDDKEASDEEDEPEPARHLAAVE